MKKHKDVVTANLIFSPFSGVPPTPTHIKRYRRK